MSKQRWKDTLPVVGIRPSLLMASQHLVHAIALASLGRTAGDRERAATAAAFAAAHIRAYRKSLGVESKRCDSLDEDMAPDELLWSALLHLCYVGMFHAPPNEPKAYHLRAAEADLRELWKRGQA